MKFFTPKRLMGLQGRLSAAHFQKALDDWEKTLAAYLQQLRTIGPKLPGSMRRLVGSVALHDAPVLAISEGPRGRFSITLFPQSDPARLVVLEYTLIDPPRITEALPPRGRSEPTAWLYDELDILSKQKIHAAPTFVHKILLSNGWEIRLHFSGVTFKRPAALWPGGANGDGLAATVSRNG